MNASSTESNRGILLFKTEKLRTSKKSKNPSGKDSVLSWETSDALEEKVYISVLERLLFTNWFLIKVIIFLLSRSLNPSIK